jgi:hypothetical protein
MTTWVAGLPDLPRRCGALRDFRFVRVVETGMCDAVRSGPPAGGSFLRLELDKQLLCGLDEAQRHHRWSAA